MIDERLGSILRERRLNTGLSQEKLAFRADVHRTYVSMVERGERAVTVKVFLRWCDALGVTPQSVLDELLAAEPNDE